jgi:hypothetical protein
MKMKIVRNQLLNKFQRNTRRHQSDNQETNEDDMTEREWVINQYARKFIAGIQL